MKLILCILLVTASNFAWADEGVEITNPNQVLELVIIEEKLDTVSTAIMVCMDSGKTHKPCLCEHKEKIIQFNASAKNFFVDRPELEKYDLVRFKTQDGTIINSSLISIRKQASIDPQCP